MNDKIVLSFPSWLEKLKFSTIIKKNMSIHSKPLIEEWIDNLIIELQRLKKEINE